MLRLLDFVGPFLKTISLLKGKTFRLFWAFFKDYFVTKRESLDFFLRERPGSEPGSQRGLLF